MLKRPDNANTDIRMLYPHGHTASHVHADMQATPDRLEAHHEHEMNRRAEPSERRKRISAWIDKCERDGTKGYLGNINYFSEREEVSGREGKVIERLENSRCLEGVRRRRWFE